MWDGFLNVKKPQGITSFDAVRIISGEIREGQSLAKRLKIGHAGTLDPLADGVLVMAIGRASRLISYVQKQRKTYVSTFLLGLSSPSEDTETEMTSVENAPQPTLAEIQAVLPEFLGEILQKPPIFSALKVNGRKAYDLARQGKEVELKARPIRIDSLEILEYAYPTLRLKIVCGSGTYVRSLGRDLARKLGTEAVMAALTRTAIGCFRIEDALEIRLRDDPRPLNRPRCTDFLRPFLDAVPDLPRIAYGEKDLWKLKNGIAVTHPDAENLLPAEEAVVVDGSGKFFGIVKKFPDEKLRSLLNFAHEID